MKKGDLVRAKMDSMIVPKGSIGIIVDPPRQHRDPRLLLTRRYVRWFSLGHPIWALTHRLEVINEER